MVKVVLKLGDTPKEALKTINDWILYCVKNRVPFDSYILEKVCDRLKELGYSEDSIGRAVFEDALDYQAMFAAHKIKRYLRNKMVPLELTFNVTVPKVE